MKTRLVLLAALVVSSASVVSAQQVTRINPENISFRGVSLASLKDGMIVGDSNYIAITHNASSTNSWSYVHSPFNASITLRAVAYAGDNVHAVIGGDQGSLAWTSDDGATWHSVALGTNATIRAITWNKSNSSNILIAVGDGGLVIRSTDQGKTWKTIAQSSTKQLNAIAFGTPTDAVAVGNDTTIIQSHDGGQTWTPMVFPYNFHKLFKAPAETAWDFDKLMGSIDFAGVCMGGSDSVWVVPDSVIDQLLIYKGEAVDTSQSFFFNTMAPYPWPNGKILLYPKFTSALYIGMTPFLTTIVGNTVDYLISTPDCDTNQNFGEAQLVGDINGTSSPSPLRTRAMADWIQDTNLLVLMVGDNSTLNQYYRTPNMLGAEQPFNPLYEGFTLPGRNNSDEFLAVTSLPSGNGFEIGGEGAFARTTNGGRNWIPIYQPISSPDSSFDNIYALDDKTALIVGWKGMIVRYDTKGFHFLPSGTSYRLESIAFPSTDTGIIVGDFGTVLQSTDRGGTWNSIAGIPTSQRLYSVAFANNQIGIATGDSATILRTTDAGSTWTSVNTALTGSNISLSSVQAFPNGTFFARAGNDLFRSMNAGKDWTSILPPGMSDTSGMDFYSPQIGMIAGRSTSTAIVGDTANLAYTTDGGLSWSPFKVPFWNDNRIIFNWLSDHEVLIYGDFGFIDDVVIGTSGVQVARMDNASAIQLYPNPSSGDLHIGYSTKASGPVQIELWDEAGKKVSTLFSGEEDAGAHEHTLNLVKSEHGAYFIRVTHDGATSTATVSVE